MNQTSQTKLDKLFARVAEQLEDREYLDVDPYEMSEAMKTTLWYLWHTDPGAVRPKALEIAAGYDLHFQTYMYPGGNTSIVFSRIGSPMSRKAQRVRA